MLWQLGIGHVGAFSGVICADSCVSSQLSSPLRSGGSLIALAGMTLLCSRWFFGLQQVSTGFIAWWLGRICGEHLEECKASEFCGQNCITSILPCFISQSKCKANPDSRDQKATKPSWEKLKVTLREMVNTQTGVIVAIFVNKPPERFYPICSLLCIS